MEQREMNKPENRILSGESPQLAKTIPANF